MASGDNTTSRRRHRSAIACEACRQRKVRCSLSVTGIPCAGCAQDRTECVVHPRRAEKTGRRNRPSTAGRLHLNPPNARGPSSDGCDMSHQPSPAYPNHIRRPDVVHERQTVPQGNTQAQERAMLPFVNSVENEERNGFEIATAALGQSQEAGQVPFYSGVHIGPISTLTACFTDQTLSSHFLVPSYASATLSEESRAYLKVNGVYTLPGNDACDSLICAYFHHVHPIMPVMEADVILSYHQTGRLHECNVLLLWCIFFIGANFVPAHIYEQEGHGSRKEMKAAMYSRAKCMYNNGMVMDNVALLQASLLLGCWHSEERGHLEPWYWTGIAVSLCQMLGLHRDPDASKFNSMITDRQRHLWRRLWWTCFSRDRWLSLTLGRPPRINLDDSDTPLPSPGDLLSDVKTAPEPIVGSFLPDDLPRLANYWIIFIRLSRLLGDVLTLNYQVRFRPSLQQTDSLEADILQCKMPDPYEFSSTRISTFYAYHLQLHYQALLITFYRPYGSWIPDNLHHSQHRDWQRRMRFKADSAASQTNVIVEALAKDNLFEFAGPMMPPLFVPAMQTHLLNCKDADPLSRRLRLNHLDMYMMIMEELQKTYTVASVYRGIFMKAIQQLFPDYSTNMRTPRSGADLLADNTNDVAVDESSTLGRAESNPPAIDMLLDVLMDEASMFNFWDTWSRL